MADRPGGIASGVATPRILLIDNFDSYTYNLAHLIASVTGVEPAVRSVDQVSDDQAEDFAAVVISPGPGHPATEQDFGTCLRLLRHGRVPVLGVCLGHQGLAIAFGGRVEPRPPAHGVVSAVHHRGDGLYATMTNPFRAVRYHSLCVTEVPEELVVDAWTSDGTVMGLRHRTLPIFGVQFHPESILSEDGARLIRAFLTEAGLLSPGEPATGPFTPDRPNTLPPPAQRPVRPGVRQWEEWLEPSDVAARLIRDEPRAFWLDSALTGTAAGRWSYVGWLEPGDESVATFVRHGDPSPFDRLAALVGDCAPSEHEGPPFTGGWVGYLGYASGDLPAKPSDGAVPDALLMRVTRLLAFDHVQRRTYLIAATPGDVEDFARHVSARLDRCSTKRSPQPAPGEHPPGEHPPREHLPPVRPAVVRQQPFGDYEPGFAEVERELLAGNTYETTLSHTVTIEADRDPLSLYLRLRELNPAPYAAYLRHGEVCVLSSSPERFLCAGPDGRLETRPIKGTTPRGESIQDDALQRWRLGHEPKFLAENLMIADLLRNDLSRVCRPGTVQVSELMTVESYASVHQLVTTVVGQRRPELGVIDCLRALFPGGSMTGAPKRRTMEIIDRVEAAPRGVFAGTLGWIGDDGACELSIVIRTLVGTGSTWNLGVGGGIVVDSTAEEEYAETRWKSSKLIEAFDA